MAGDQALVAIEVDLREGELGLRACLDGLGVGQRGLERTRIDGEEQVALLDQLAVAEMDLLDDAGNLGADLDAVDGADAAGELSPTR